MVPVVGDYDWVGLWLLAKHFAVVQTAMRADVQAQREQETACLGSPKHPHQPCLAGACLLVQVPELSWQGATAPVQGLFSTRPLGLLSKLMPSPYTTFTHMVLTSLLRQGEEEHLRPI